MVTSSELIEEGYYKVIGDLTIKGKTSPIEFSVSVSTVENGMQVSGAFAFDRTKYGINYPNFLHD